MSQSIYLFPTWHIAKDDHNHIKQSFLTRNKNRSCNVALQEIDESCSSLDNNWRRTQVSYDGVTPNKFTTTANCVGNVQVVRCFLLNLARFPEG